LDRPLAVSHLQLMIFTHFVSCQFKKDSSIGAEDMNHEQDGDYS